ncbi:MAG: hypothetical protein RLP02_14280 [Coleofasciculus sp. C2-GNP5-27]
MNRSRRFPSGQLNRAIAGCSDSHQYYRAQGWYPYVSVKNSAIAFFSPTPVR